MLYENLSALVCLLIVYTWKYIAEARIFFTSPNLIGLVYLIGDASVLAKVLTEAPREINLIKQAWKQGVYW